MVLVTISSLRPSAVAPSEETASLAVVETTTGYFGLSQTTGRPYWHSQNLLDWKKVGTARFSSPKVDTVSNPFRSKNQWTVLYEQQDRIYRAVLNVANVSSRSERRQCPKIHSLPCAF
jgi:hypothetical protein